MRTAFVLLLLTAGRVLADDYTITVTEPDPRLNSHTYSFYAMGDSDTIDLANASNYYADQSSAFVVWDETSRRHIHDPVTGRMIWMVTPDTGQSMYGGSGTGWHPGAGGWLPLRPYLIAGHHLRLVPIWAAVPAGFPNPISYQDHIVSNVAGNSQNSVPTILTVGSLDGPSPQTTYSTDGQHLALTGTWHPVEDDFATLAADVPQSYIYGQSHPMSQVVTMPINDSRTLTPVILGDGVQNSQPVVHLSVRFTGHEGTGAATTPWTAAQIAQMNASGGGYTPTVTLSVVSGPHVGRSATAKVAGKRVFSAGPSISENLPVIDQNGSVIGTRPQVYYPLRADLAQLYAGFDMTSTTASAHGKDVLIATTSDGQQSDPLTIDWDALRPITVADTEQPGPRDCPACDGQIVATTSVVESGLQAHVHDAVDYAMADGGGGCASCGGGAPGTQGQLPSLEIHRYHRYLDQAWRGSFGPGVFLGYDHRLVVHAAARVIEWWTPQRPVVTLLKDPTGSGTFADVRFHDVAGCVLADAAGHAVSDPLIAKQATLTMFDGSTETYELIVGADESGDTRDGRVVALADRNGQGISLAYATAAAVANGDTCYQIATITDAHGLVARCSYGLSDGHPVIQSIDLPNGTRLRYGYGGDSGTLIGLRSVGFPDGTAASFDTVWSTTDQLQVVRYDDPGAVGIHRRKQVGFTPIDVTWAGGAVAVGPNRVRKVVNGDGELVYKCWLEAGGPVGSVAATTLVYFFDGGDDAHGAAMRRLTTDNGLILASERATTWSWSTDEGTWTWQKVEDDTLDATQRLTSRATPGVGQTTFERDPVTGAITKTTYPDRTAEATTYNELNEPLTQTDRLGRVTTFTYDAQGNLLSRTAAAGTAEAATTQWRYAEAGSSARPGQPSSMIDPLGNVTRYVYDAHGFLASVVEPKDVASDAANPTKHYAHDAAGHLTSSIDEDGREVTYAYDSRNRVTTITYGDGSSEGFVYGSQADGSANLPVLRHDRNGAYTLLRYDASGREIARYEGLVLAEGATASTSLSSFANAESASLTTTSYVAGTDAVAERIDNGQATDFVYDSYRREISRSWSNLNGNVITDLTRWDASGRVDARAHSIVGTGTWSTLYVYDGLDRVTRTIQEATPNSAAALATPAQRLAATRAAVPAYLIEDRAYEVSPAVVGYTPADPIKSRVCEIRTTTDPRGIVHLDAFDHQARVVEHVDALGTPDMARTAFEYDAAGNRTRVYHPRHFTEAGGFTTAFAYTGRNLRALVREAEGRTEQSDTLTAYTATGKVASVTQAAGTVDSATTVYRYGTCCDRLREVQDPAGFLTQYLYDANGNTTAVVDALQHATVMEYDSRNRVVRRTDGEGHVTRYVYDDNIFDGHGLDASFTSLWQGLTLVTQAGQPASAPRAVATIYATGAVTYAVSDQLGRTWSMFDALKHETSMTHDAGASGSTSTTDALGDYTATQMDGAGRLRATTDSEFRQATFTVDGNGNRLTTSDPNGNGPSATYDGRDRLATLTDSVGSTVTRGYDAQGNLVSTRDALGRTSTFTYDGRNRKISVTDRLGAMTRFAYDRRNNLVAMEDAEHRVTTYRYDPRNLLIVETFPGSSGGTRTYDYDAAGRLWHRTDQTGTVTRYEYDRANRLIARRYPDGLDDQLAYDAVGRLTHATSARYANAVDRVFDAAGRLVSETQTIAGVAYTVGHGYDDVNRLTHIGYPGGDSVDRSYTARSQLQQLTFDGVPVAARTYDPAMRLATTSYFPTSKPGGAATETRSYNRDDTVATIKAPGVNSLTYAYNGDKSVTSETDGTIAASSQTFAYDDEQRLSAWSRGNGDHQSWDLSSVGDWKGTTVDGVLESRTHSDVHEVTSITRGTVTAPIGYDAKGNLALDQNGARYGWDVENRLTSASITDDIDNVGDVATYAYDALGRRVQKTAWGVTTTFIHDGDQVVREFDAPQQLPPSAANDDGDGSGTPPGGGILPNALVRVNFQPALRAIPPGFVADKGKALGVRTNGYSYGWDIARTDTVARGVHPLPQFDTFDQMWKANQGTAGTWSIALPNGTYPVIVVMGDAASRHQTNNVVIQGIAETDPDPYDPAETQGYLKGDFDGYAELVTVSNGTLTIQVGSGAIDPKLCFIEIGHNGDPLDQATKDKLAAQVGAATQRTGGTPFPKPQPSPREYAYGSYVDEPLMYSAAGTKYSVLANRQYSVTALVDASGNVAERYQYDAYGKRTVLNGTGVAIGSDSLVAFERGYTGLRVDCETGLLQAQYRMFDVGLGRWISRDPAGYVDGTSLYHGYFIPNGMDPIGFMTFALDKANCTATLQYKFFVKFDDDAWWSQAHKVDRHSDFKARLVTSIENQWNKGGAQFRITPAVLRTTLAGSGSAPNPAVIECNCPNGWIPKVSVTFADKEGDADAIITAHPVGDDTPNRTSFGVNVNGTVVWRFSQPHVDLNYTSTMPGIKEVAIDGQHYVATDPQGDAAHEFGHLLGLEHPGGDNNSARDYVGSDGSGTNLLMGLGAQMIPGYYNAWTTGLQNAQPNFGPYSVQQVATGR